MAINWSEIQPAGNSDKRWSCSAISNDGNVIMCAVVTGRVYLSSNFGVSFSEIQPNGNSDQNWTSICCSSNGAVIYAHNGSYAYKSSDTGANFGSEITNTLANAYIDCNSDGSKVAWGYFNKPIYVSLDGGATSSSKRSSANYNFINYSYNGGMIMSSIYNTANGLTFSTDNGDNWTTKAVISGTYTGKGSQNDDGSIMIITVDNKLYLSTNSGSTFSEVQPAGATTKQWSGMAVSGDGSVIIAITNEVGTANGGRVYISKDTGATWSEERPAGNVDRAWAVVSVSRDGKYFLVGQDVGQDTTYYKGRLYLGVMAASNSSNFFQLF